MRQCHVNKMLTFQEGRRMGFISEPQREFRQLFFLQLAHLSFFKQQRELYEAGLDVH